MSTNVTSAKSLINDMLTESTERFERTLRNLIESQIRTYESAKKDTFQVAFGRISKFDLLQHFRYQAVIKQTLTEMERTYLEYFGKPWDYVEPVVEKPKSKRGRPAKAK